MLTIILYVLAACILLTFHGLVVVWHIKKYLEKYGKILPQEVFLSIFWLMPVLGWLLYAVPTFVMGREVKSYLDF